MSAALTIPTNAASTGAHTHRHRSGHPITHHGDGWAVMSADGSHVLRRTATLDEATAWCDEHFADRAARHIHILGAVGKLRTGEFQGKTHIVVPVVALVGDQVIWPVNAPAPEFVPAEVLAMAPAGWNGRPAVNGHPEQDGTQVTANTPRTLEAYGYGTLFDAEFADGRLRFEAWLDPARALQVGSEAVRSLERLEAGDVVEVSVGCYVTTEPRQGVDALGRAYASAWTSIVPDHLAILPEGQTGACSVKAGCGAGRAATVHKISADGMRMLPQTEAKERSMSNTGTTPPAPKPAPPAPAPPASPAPQAPPPPSPPKRTLRQRLASVFAFLAAEEDLSDQDLRYALNDALRAVEPGFQGIESVFPNDAKVIYWVMPEDAWLTVRRGYTLGTDGVITLADDREEVRPVTRYEPVAASAAPTTAADCGCGGHKPQQPAQPATGGTAMNEQERAARAARAKALIDNPATVWTAADQQYLEGQPEARLAELEAHAADKKPAAPAKDPAPPLTGQPEPSDQPNSPNPLVAPGPNTPASRPVQSPVPEERAAKVKTEAEWLAEAPPALRSMVARQQAAEAARKTALVTTLKAAQAEYTEAELQAMPLDQLERTARLAAAAVPELDYAAVGAPRAAAAQDVYTNPPNGYRMALDARKQPAAPARKES